MDQNVFAKYTVLDFTRGDFGAVCSEYLGLYGMNVIRVEVPGNQDHDNEYLYLTKNLNKKVVTLDPENKNDKEMFWTLIEKSDIFVENLPNAKIKELGLDYEAVKARNPGIIYTSIQPYSTGYKYQDYPSNSSTISASGGATYLCGYTGGEPLEPGMNLPDIISSAYSALGLFSLLYRKECTGEGDFMEVSEQESIVALARSAYEFYHTNRRNNRPGNSFPTLPDMVPMDMFRAKDGFVIIGCMDPKAFEVLCTTIGREDLLKDPRFKDWRTRSRYKAELNAIITEWTLQHDKDEIMHLLLEKGRIVASVVTEVDDIINNEDLRRLGVMQKVEYKDLGEMWVPAMPCLSSEIKIKAEPPQAVGTSGVL